MATETTTRSYVDSYAVKDFAINTLAPKYFSDIDVSFHTVGMLGMTLEQISNISEDAFNTMSVLFRESFPNRALLPESIYSNAALFQLSDAFSNAASSTFLILLSESAVLENMVDNYDKDTGIYHVYIDKNTIFYVENIKFTLDYDIDLSIIEKSNTLKTEYVYSAKYITSSYTNSISKINSPYIKIRRSGNGILALEVDCHQCERVEKTSQITSNSALNSPVLDFTFDGNLAGFDVLYKSPGNTSYDTQLTPLVAYSQKIQTPFCFYKLTDDNTLTLTFNTNDDYFIPEYGSTIKVILYITLGTSGEFSKYNGSDLTIDVCEENYTYQVPFMLMAKPMTSSIGASDHLTLDELKSLTIEKLRTATVLSTNADLNEYFSNSFKIDYGNSEIYFTKTRDDISARIHSGYILMKNADYIYKTNTLNLDTNLSDLKKVDESTYIIEPGTLFYADIDNDGYADFLRTSDYETYYNEYLEAIENNEIPYIENVSGVIPDYLDRNASFAEFKQRKGYNDQMLVFNYSSDELSEYDDPQNDKFLYVNPFLIKFNKNPNLMSMYLTCISNTSIVDFINQNDDAYLQFITYQMEIGRGFTKDKKYDISIKILPSVGGFESTHPLIHKTEDESSYVYNDPYTVSQNDLRIVVVFENNGVNVCYTELYPSEYDSDDDTYTFKGSILTDDYITSDGRLRLLSGAIYINMESREYYKVHSDDSTLYDKYDSNDTVIETDINSTDVMKKVTNGELVLWRQVINMDASDYIYVPMSDITCKIYMLYKKVYSDDANDMVDLTEDQTNNIFVTYDDSFIGYMWTNVYDTSTYPISLILPLNNVRSTLEFKDYTATTSILDDTGESKTEFTNDIMDVHISRLPFIRWDICKDSDALGYFMESFLNQYENLLNVTNERLTGLTSMDIKFYNSYGPSKNFTIGENDESLNTVNMTLEMDIWFIQGTDLLTVIPEIREFIKSEIEGLNCTINSFYISNLIRKIETNFAYVDHIRFISINGKSSNYQSVKNCTTDIDELTIDERRNYVPEMLVIDLEDITINDYIV